MLLVQYLYMYIQCKHLNCALTSLSLLYACMYNTMNTAVVLIHGRGGAKLLLTIESSGRGGAKLLTIESSGRGGAKLLLTIESSGRGGAKLLLTIESSAEVTLVLEEIQVNTIYSLWN